ncbi:hypothetical protein [Alkalihalobacterium alkalinitrilicum]|uniref:hypothetical protein n=1 Tax=Alkalihalobacterium alkalinitrilicum TaxID=427920 RepID=UPI000995984E|nr:hypothetical protein [Alkalihalobacterium alkalinitrilicum]
MKMTIERLRDEKGRFIPKSESSKMQEELNSHSNLVVKWVPTEGKKYHLKRTEREKADMFGITILIIFGVLILLVK